MNSTFTASPSGWWAANFMPNFLIMREADFSPRIRTARGSGEVALHHLSGLTEYPRVADAAAGDGDRVDAGQFEHGEDVAGLPDVAGTEDQFPGVAFDEVGEEFPRPRSQVALLDAAAMHRHPRIPQVVGGIEDALEVCRHLARVVPPTPDLDRDGDTLGHDIADGGEDRDRLVGGGEEMPAAIPLLDFLDRAGEVDVDDIVVHGQQDAGARGHLVGERAHDLPGNWVIVMVRSLILIKVAGAAFFGEEVGVFAGASFAATDEDAIQQGFGDGERAAVASCDQAHGGVGVSGQPRLEERRIEARHQRLDTLIVGEGPGDLADRAGQIAQDIVGWQHLHGHGGDDIPRHRFRSRVDTLSGMMIHFRDGKRAGKQRGGWDVRRNRTRPRESMRFAASMRPGWILFFLSLMFVYSGCGRVMYVPTQATRSYSHELHTIDTVDIQVFRDVELIELVNATVHSYLDFDIWINQRYVLHVDQMLAGETIRLSLWDFFDERGDRFNAGGFWATREPERVRLVEMQPAQNLPMVGLLTIRSAGED